MQLMALALEMDVEVTVTVTVTAVIVVVMVASLCTQMMSSRRALGRHSRKQAPRWAPPTRTQQRQLARQRRPMLVSAHPNAAGVLAYSVA